MRPFAIKKAAVSVLCHGSYNSLNDKRYNAVFIRITPVIYADRLQERRSTIALNTEPYEVGIRCHNLICFGLYFLSFLGVICGRQERQYLELGSIIFKTNAIVSLELTLTLIVLDFLEKSSYWINYIAFHDRYAFSARPKKSIPLPSIAASHELCLPGINKTHQI